MHAVALAVIVSFVWATLDLTARRVPRAGQIEFALWLLGSERAAPWWKNQPMVTAALADSGRPIAARIASTAIVTVCALTAAAAVWAAVSRHEFLAWFHLMSDWPAANAGMVAVPTLFVAAAIYIALGKSDRIATSMARASEPRGVAVWAAIDLTNSAALALLGWIAFLVALIATGREREFSHLATRAWTEAAAGWQTGLGFAADRRGWPSWGVWFYAIVLTAMLPWLHGLAAWSLRRAVRHARPLVERADALGLIDLENRPLAAIAAVAAVLAGGGYSLIAIVR